MAHVKFSLGMKINGMVLTLILTTCSAGFGLYYYTIQQIGRYDDVLGTLLTINTLSIIGEQIHQNIQVYEYSPSDELKTTIQRDVDRLVVSFHTINIAGDFQQQEHDTLIEDLQRIIGNVQQSAQLALELLDRQDDSEELLYALEDLESLKDILAKNVDKYMTRELNDAVPWRQAVLQTHQKMHVLVLVLLPIMVIGCTVGGIIFFSRVIKIPLQQLVAMADAVSQGDLRHPFPPPS